MSTRDAIVLARTAYLDCPFNAKMAQAAATAARQATDEAEKDAVKAEENAKIVKQEYSEIFQTNATQDQAEAAAATSARQAESKSKAKKRQGKGSQATDPLLINEERKEEFVTIWGEDDPSGPPPPSPPVSDFELFNLCGGGRKKDK